jgi:hypothetical protein
MKSFKDYLAEGEQLEELSQEETNSSSPISGEERQAQPNPVESVGGTRELGIGDPVIVKDRVQHGGEKGKVVEFGKDKHFVVVEFPGNKKYSFHASDVEFDDYADGNDEDEMYQHELNNLRKMSGYQ